MRVTKPLELSRGKGLSHSRFGGQVRTIPLADEYACVGELVSKTPEQNCRLCETKRKLFRKDNAAATDLSRTAGKQEEEL
jgi:hypothetical protein